MYNGIEKKDVNVTLLTPSILTFTRELIKDWFPTTKAVLK